MQVLPVNFVKFLKTAFSKNTSGGCFWSNKLVTHSKVSVSASSFSERKKMDFIKPWSIWNIKPVFPVPWLQATRPKTRKRVLTRRKFHNKTGSQRQTSTFPIHKEIRKYISLQWEGKLLGFFRLCFSLCPAPHFSSGNY